MVMLCLCSCAHKSGHGNTHSVPSNTTGTQRPPRNRPAPAPSPPTTPTTRTAPPSAPAPYVPPTTGDDHNGKTKLDGKDIFQRYNTAVFMVHTSDGHNYYQGSGFFIDNNGLAVSNYHVFEGTTLGREQIKLPGSNNVYKVSEVIQRSAEKDFILFRVNISNTNYVPVAKSKPSIGEKLYAIGSPRGFENTFSSGEVSQWRDEYTIQTSVPLDHGSSGGALINEYGEVVGITSGTLYRGSTAAVNYAVSIDVVKPYINIR